VYLPSFTLSLPQSMITLGLTGGIGSGKTAVAARLAEKPGVRVVFADDEAKRLMHEDAALRAALVARLGPETYDAESRLDRAGLAQRARPPRRPARAACARRGRPARRRPASGVRGGAALRGRRRPARGPRGRRGRAARNAHRPRRGARRRDARAGPGPDGGAAPARGAPRAGRLRHRERRRPRPPRRPGGRPLRRTRAG